MDETGSLARLLGLAVFQTIHVKLPLHHMTRYGLIIWIKMIDSLRYHPLVSKH